MMPMGTVPPKPIAPRRLWIVDATTEKVARILGMNPDGLICFRDELSGLLGSFDKYGGSGGDRAFWLEAYGGRSYRYDRVSLTEPVDIPFCAVSLLGGLQPDRLNSMILSGDDDGLAARPLYAWPNPVRPRRPEKKPDNASMLAALRRLSRLTFDDDPVEKSVRVRIIPLTADAADEFSAWWQKTQWDAKIDVTGRIAGAIGKLDGIALRIAQVLEFLTWAWGQSNEPEPAQVSLLSIIKAIRIIEEWVRPNLERVFAEASMPKAQRDAMTVGRWLLKTKPDSIVNARELRRQPGFPGPKDAKELDEALQILVDARWLEPVPEERPGRPRKGYAINPAVFEACMGK